MSDRAEILRFAAACCREAASFSDTDATDKVLQQVGIPLDYEVRGAPLTAIIRIWGASMLESMAGVFDELSTKDDAAWENLKDRAANKGDKHEAFR